MSRWPLRYAPWAARDAVLGPGLIAFVCVLGVTLIGARLPAQSSGPEGAARLADRLVGFFDWFLVLVACGGVVSGDIAGGVYRTVFARPVSPAWYYLQRWLVAGVVVGMAAPLLTLAMWPVTGFLLPPWGLVIRLFTLFVLLGGLTFVLSTVTQRDWFIALMLFILQGTIHWAVTQADDPSSLARGLHAILPPFHLAVGPRRPTGWEVVWPLGYGATLVAGALIILSRRPLASGVRAI